MAKKRMLELVPIWRDRGMKQDLKVKLVRALKADEKRIQAAEMWIYPRMLRISWKERRTNESVMLQLNTTRQLLGFVLRRKLSYLGHTHREGGCELVKTVIQGKVPGKRRRGRPRASYSIITSPSGWDEQ